MKSLEMLSLRLRRIVARGGSAVIGFRRRAQAECCRRPGSVVLRRLIRRLKSQWKQAVSWERTNAGLYAYDVRSYSLNFDDGCCLDEH
ncbi:hypothetical protein U1Q18_020395, partial [Sarracenia purpurea var. burkii]